MRGVMCFARDARSMLASGPAAKAEVPSAKATVRKQASNARFIARNLPTFERRIIV